MERIGSMLDRAIQNRRRRQLRHDSPQPQSNAAPLKREPSLHHAEYAALMRSHDRVHSRHVNGNGRSDGA